MIVGFVLIFGAWLANFSWPAWCFIWFLVGALLDLERKEKEKQ